jgi:hypothetical protein
MFGVYAVKGRVGYGSNVILYTGKVTVQHGYGLDNAIVIYTTKL